MTPSPPREDAESYARGGGPGRPRAWVRRLLVAGLGIALLLVTALLLLADILAPGVAEWVGNRALPWEGARVQVASADVRWSGLTATGIRLTAGPGDTAVVDTLVVDLSLPALLGSPHRVRRIRAVGVRIGAVNGGAGWGWLAPFDSAEPDTTPPATGPALAVDRVEVRNAVVDARDGGGALILGLAGVEAAVDSLLLGVDPSLRAEIDAERLVAPDWIDVPLRVQARGSAGDGAWTLERLDLHEPAGGRLMARGRADARASGDWTVDLRVEGRDLPVARLHPLLAGADSSQRATLDAAIRGPATAPRIEARVAVEDAGAVVATVGVDRVDGRLRLDGRLVAERLDVDRITGGRAGVDPVSGEVEAQLAQGSEGRMDGPIRIDLATGAGAHPVRVAGGAELVDGEAQVDLDATWDDLSARLAGHIRFGTPIPTYDIGLDMRSV
ncbi:MAG: hypothetical protein P8177_12460, partial [Gemmatimonadota bacterium]